MMFLPHPYGHRHEHHHAPHWVVLLVRFALLLLAAFLLVLATPALSQEVRAASAATAATAATASRVERAASAGTTAVARRDSATRADSAATAAALPNVTFHGEVRARGELDHLGDAPADAFTYLRTRFGAHVDVGEGARVVVSLQDSRVLGTEHGSSPAGSLDLHDGYVELERPWKAVRLGVRAGRQEIAFGNERLVGAVNWSNTGRTFDALRLTIGPEDAAGAAWSATAFGATLDERGRRFGSPAPADGDASDHMVFGAHATLGRAAGATPSPLLLDATLVHDVAGTYRAYADADRTTLDLRLRAPRLGGLRAELEGALQTGRQQWLPADAAQPAVRQDVRAWLLAARLGTAAPLGRLTSATLGVDVLSGDEDPTDGTYGAFATMYATNHPYYGLMDLFGDPAVRTRDRGLTDAFASTVLRLTPAVSLRTDVHRFALATGPDRYLGWELDLVAPVRLTRNAGLELGYGVYRGTASAEPLGLRSGEWGYLQMRVGF